MPRPRRGSPEIVEVLLADDRRSWQLGPDAVWRRTEEILGVPGTIDAQEELKERALAASTVIAVPRRPARRCRLARPAGMSAARSAA